MKKHWNTYKKIACIAGMAYGLWVAAHLGATEQDTFSGFAIVILSLTIALSCADQYMTDNPQ